MSWFKRDSPFRSSLRGKFALGVSAMTGASAASPAPVEHNAEACFDSFKNHWQQAWETMCNILGPMSPKSLLHDQITSVLNHLDQMMVLLLHDLRRADQSIGPLLDLVLTEDILNKLLMWSAKTGEYVYSLKLEQLKLYELLITQSRQEVLVHKPILQPLLRLLSTCRECSPVEVEKRLVILLNQLCVSLTQNATLLEFFFNASCNQGPANFLIFSLLIPFVHREGGIGQQARDALLLCMSLSRRNEGIGIYIAEHSSFCPVLATGLSGLYSLLPRKLIIESDDWHRFTPEDIHDLPELGMFLNSLEFCNAVSQVAHSLVQEQLLEYLNQGFLLPVLIPALQPSVQQPCVEELITVTAYLDLFIRTITEPSLLRAFLHALLMESPEGPPVIQDLVLRIAGPHPLSVVTLALFQTLLNLNCEDIMLELVFKYLITCTHIMVSQRCRVREIDLFGKTAEKFLSLLPSCCLLPGDEERGVDGATATTTAVAATSLSSSEHGPHSMPGTLPRTVGRRRRTPSSASFSPGDIFDYLGGQTSLIPSPVMPSSFLEYLLDARQTVSACSIGCRCWAWPYDGERPLPETLLMNLSTLPQQQQPPPPSSSAFGGCSAMASKGCSNSDSYPNFLVNRSVNKEPTTNSTSDVNGDEPFLRENGKCVVVVESGVGPSNDLSGENLLLLFGRDSITKGPKLNRRTMSVDERQLGCCYGDVEPPLARGGDFAVEVSSKTFKFPRQPSLHDRRDSQGKFSCRTGNVLSGASYATDGFGSPDLGPFLSILLTKLENMMSNNIYENLQLTGVISRLACYPQPLLRSFLLNHSLVFQPSVRSLLQVLGTLKQKLDSFFYTVDNVEDLVLRARKFLAFRDEKLFLDGGLQKSAKKETRTSPPDGFNKGEGRRLSLTERLFKRSPLSSEREKNNYKLSFLDAIPNDTGYRYIKSKSPESPDGKLESLRMKNAILCTVVLEEFLKELSAIAMEHAIVIEEEN